MTRPARLLLLLLALPFIAPAQKSAKRELRGAWISTYLGLDWPVRTQTPAQQQSALLNILNSHQAAGINTVYLQVRSQADALYSSALVPWSYDLTGTQGTAPNPLWDPLSFSITESRKRGFEFHAWLNPFRAVANTANANNAAMYSNAHVSKTNPQWMLTVGTVQIINPGIPAARAHIVSVITDLLRRYDVDGIHFDDYFYPSGTINDDAEYTADPRGFPATTAGRADWRRDNINLFIQTVYDSIRTIKPWVKFGVSPSGIYRSSTDPTIGSNTSSGALQHYSSYFADTKKWLQQGWVDYIAPQLYWYRGQSGSDYNVLVPWWNDNAFGRHIYIGIAAYKVNDPAQGANWASPAQLPSQVRMNREAIYPNVVGSIYFRTQHIIANPLGIRDSLRLNLYNRPALQPRMPWRDNAAPAAPTSLAVAQYGSDSIVLNWVKPAAAANELDRARQYVVYRSQTSPVDTADAANILAIVGDTSAFKDLSYNPGNVYFYVVSALDRFHNESALSNLVSNVSTALPQVALSGPGVLVYPNPAPGAFLVRVTAGPAEPVEIRIANAAGRVVEQLGAGKGPRTVAAGGRLLPGLYFVEVRAGKGRTVVPCVRF